MKIIKNDSKKLIAFFTTIQKWPKIHGSTLEYPLSNNFYFVSWTKYYNFSSSFREKLDYSHWVWAYRFWNYNNLTGKCYKYNYWFYNGFINRYVKFIFYYCDCANCLLSISCLTVYPSIIIYVSTAMRNAKPTVA